MGVHLPCFREVSGSNIDPETICAEVILFLTATQGRKITNVYTVLVSHCNKRYQNREPSNILVVNFCPAVVACLEECIYSFTYDSFTDIVSSSHYTECFDCRVTSMKCSATNLKRTMSVRILCILQLWQ
jgi:hypothetical protein